MSVLYLVRHGQSEWNRLGRIQGRSESPLTALGREQARVVGEYLVEVLAAVDFEIVVSPAGRARETASIIARRLERDPADVVVDERLADFDLGVLAGMPGWDAVAEIDPELAYRRLHDPLAFWPSGGESGAQVAERVREFLAHREALGRPTLAVCHGIINKYIRGVRRGITGAEMIALGEDQDVVYRLEGVMETELRAMPSLDIGDASATVRVELGDRGYDIVIGEHLLGRSAGVLAAHIAGRQVAVVTDETVAVACLPALAPALDAHCKRWFQVLVPGGEATKSFADLEALLEQLLDEGMDRGSVVVALGGGVVGDVAGLAAALFMRGIPLVQIPTTLMSQVDSAVGGKNAINARHGKNLVGTFHQPGVVLNDVSVLATLPRRELLAGYAEIVKYALIRGEAELAWLEANAAALLALEGEILVEAVRLGCETKGDIVARDERDRGERAIVNLGHTFAHALEADAGYGALLHGEAVAAGLAAAASLSERLGHCSADLVVRLRRHLADVGLPDRIATLPSNRNWTPASLHGHMRHDKKTVGGRINFVLLRGPGEPFVSDEVPESVLLDVLADECRRT
jgi:3-dehydroquinate synthase